MKCLFVCLLFVFTGCGVGAHVDGKVDTSGTITVKVDISDVISFFTSECQSTAHPKATQEQINECVSRLTQDFTSYLSKVH